MRMTDRRFVALLNFESGEGVAKSKYKKGAYYTLREGNETLKTKTAAWLLEGKIVFEDDPNFKSVLAAHKMAEVPTGNVAAATVSGSLKTNRPGQRK